MCVSLHPIPPFCHTPQGVEKRASDTFDSVSQKEWSSQLLTLLAYKRTNALRCPDCLWIVRTPLRIQSLF